jgi:hypothetical protein
MKSIGKRALVLLGSSLFGATLWLAVFTVVVVGSARLKDVGAIDGVLVTGGGFILAGTLGIAPPHTLDTRGVRVFQSTASHRRSRSEPL